MPMTMKLIRRILATLRPARPRYSEDVLLSGWVQLPKAIRGIIARR